MKMLKRAGPAAGIALLSAAVTLAVFETLSWYHPWDRPTPVVLLRMAIVWAAAACGLAVAVRAAGRRKTLQVKER